MDGWDQDHQKSQEKPSGANDRPRYTPPSGWPSARSSARDDPRRSAMPPAPPNSQLLQPLTDRTTSEYALPAESGGLGRMSGFLRQSAPLAAPATSPTAKASAALNHLIAVMERHAPHWQTEAILRACQRMSSSGAPLAYDFGFQADARLMNVMSHTIEDCVIARRLPCEFYVGFQRLSLMGMQAQRYMALASCVRYVYAYGLDDIVGQQSPFAPNVLRFAIQPRHGSDLLWYWFLVVDHPYQRMALLAQQRSGYIWNRSFAERVYNGFWTVNPEVTQQVVTALRQAARAIYYS